MTKFKNEKMQIKNIKKRKKEKKEKKKTKLLVLSFIRHGFSL